MAERAAPAGEGDTLVAWAPADGWLAWLARGWRLCGHGLAPVHRSHAAYAVLVWRPAE